MKEIEKYLASYFGIGGKDLSSVGALFKKSRIQKNEYVLRQDQYSRNLSFIETGYLRVSAPDKHGVKQITQWIAGPGEFIVDLSSFVFGTPSRWDIAALTECTVHSIGQEDYKDLHLFVKNWPEIEKLFLTKCFLTMEQRIFNLLSMTAEEKYLEFFNVNPEIFNQVPLQYLASMLGMTPETLSRIRKKMIS